MCAILLQLVNLEEARRRMSLAEDECIAMPEMLDTSTLLTDEHIIKVNFIFILYITV